MVVFLLLGTEKGSPAASFGAEEFISTLGGKAAEGRTTIRWRQRGVTFCALGTRSVR